jgi:ribosomal protein S12 methylthiotransferase
MSPTFHITSLGCAKNTVDSASMGQLLLDANYQLAADPNQADGLIVNTCGFIAPAKAESIRVLGELAARKGAHQTLIAAGCLTQRYGAEVAEQVPGVDAILGTRRWMDILQVVDALRKRKHPEPLLHLPPVPDVSREDAGALRASIQGNSAYLKIADGCRRPCAFCAIPGIKGSLVSRPMDAILHDARELQAMGVREIILIAQDTTDYGHDLGLRDGLARLLEALLPEIPEVDWVRILYAYPGYVTDRLIAVMAEHPQVLPYLDIPLQHAHPDTLRRMRRPANMDWVRRTLGKMRRAMPDLTLRTTFIVGYPGETEAEFQALLDFVAEMEFDRVGAFQYSLEEGTAAEPLGDPVPAEVKQARWERLMALQQGISLRRNQSFVGKTLDVLIEGVDAARGIPYGRSTRDAPEIDGVVLIESGEVTLGEIVPVRITGALTYDLTGGVRGQPVVLAGQ